MGNKLDRGGGVVMESKRSITFGVPGQGTIVDQQEVVVTNGKLMHGVHSREQVSPNGECKVWRQEFDAPKLSQDKHKCGKNSLRKKKEKPGEWATNNGDKLEGKKKGEKENGGCDKENVVV